MAGYPEVDAPGQSAPGYSSELVDRDVELGDADLDRIARLIHRRAGIVLARHKRGMIYGRLVKRVRVLGFTRFHDYLDLLEQRLGGEEGEIFVNALTTNLTAFFRESHHFDQLARHLSGRRGPVRIWCAGVSTGEEAWSVAITLRQVLRDRADARVLGTDVDTAALERARKGIYPLTDVVKHEERDIRPFFFKGQGASANLARVRPELANMVEFVPLNLVEPEWDLPGAPFDAIFCRNVMIYFDKKTQSRVLSRFVPQLKHDGLLIAGHSESFTNLSDAFRLRGKTIYTLAR